MPETSTRPTKATPIEPGDPEEIDPVTGRPADEPPDNSTFAERAKAVQSAENKAVRSADTKKPAKKK